MDRVLLNQKTVEKWQSLISFVAFIFAMDLAKPWTQLTDRCLGMFFMASLPHQRANDPSVIEQIWHWSAETRQGLEAMAVSRSRIVIFWHSNTGPRRTTVEFFINPLSFFHLNYPRRQWMLVL